MKFYREELSRLENNLEHLELQVQNCFDSAEKGIQLCAETLSIMRERVSKNGFKNIQDECYFFKSIKPTVVGRLFHFTNLVQIERHCPILTWKEKHKFYIEHISVLKNYFIEHHEIYEYYIRNFTHLDIEYFTRKTHPIEFYPDAIVSVIDMEFSTAKDIVFSHIIGNTLTINYLKNKLSRKQSKHIKNEQSRSPLKWTGSKVDLVELIYSLQASNLINNGNVGIKELAKIMEHLFSIELGDYYRTFLEIRMRKINQTKLLDFLKTCIQNKVIEADG